MTEQQEKKWNVKHGAIKRLMGELQDIQREQSSDFVVQPLEENMFEWHFTIRGPSDTEFQGGLYHGRILFPTEYPIKPPDIVFLTPNGRFEVGQKICLNITSFHKETWNPMWGVRSVLLALISYFPQEMKGVGSMELSKPIRQKLAKESVHWKCSLCGENCSILPPVSANTVQIEEVSPENVTQSENKTQEQLKQEIEQPQKEQQTAPVVEKIVKKEAPKKKSVRKVLPESKWEMLVNSLIYFVLVFISLILIRKATITTGMEEFE